MNGNEVENEESISDADLENIVGVVDSSELAELDAPSTLQCELRPYQKQALHWMIHLEKGQCTDEAATTLHPCWEAYHLADKRGLVVYLNAFSGDATMEFPSTLQMARGGKEVDLSIVLPQEGPSLKIATLMAFQINLQLSQAKKQSFQALTTLGNERTPLLEAAI